jgi:hypothetical protein
MLLTYYKLKSRYHGYGTPFSRKVKKKADPFGVGFCQISFYDFFLSRTSSIIPYSLASEAIIQ